MTLMREARQRGEPPQNFRKHPVGGGRIIIRDEINDFPEVDTRLRMEVVSRRHLRGEGRSAILRRSSAST